MTLARPNPLKLNALQLKTLTLFQAMAEDPGRAMADGETGEVTIGSIPHPHGDHFHVGPYVVGAANASGLTNAGVWKALERKSLIRGMFPSAVTLTAEGLAYETGLKESILHPSGH
ncbi:hypothetical protein [Rhodospirillum sp. A1_3_36]|uniref:hypothetical protein n=1 Tax=Rhodospirillum sp. A1_3_36 TaxID=3391666 RepID=UPI0039A6EE44